MPKERRKTSYHAPSVKIHNRPFAVQENAVQDLPGLDQDLTPNEVLEKLEQGADDALPVLKKKEKQQLKHELFLERLEQTRAPYSKSHARRLKRKEKQSLKVDLGEMQSVLETMVPEVPPIEVPSVSSSSATPSSTIALGNRKQHLSTKQRRRVLDAERARQSVIVSNANFVKNPFAIIRSHVENTLAKAL